MEWTVAHRGDCFIEFSCQEYEYWGLKISASCKVLKCYFSLVTAHQVMVDMLTVLSSAKDSPLVNPIL